MFILTDAEKQFGLTHHLFMIEILCKLRIERNFLNLIKGMYQKKKKKKKNHSMVKD